MNLKNKVQLYPKNLGDKLGFDRIQALLSGYCQCELGRNNVKKMAVYGEVETIRILLDQTMEFKQIMGHHEIEKPDTSFAVLKEFTGTLAIRNTVLTHEQFLLLRSFLRHWAYLIKLLRKYEFEFPTLHKLANEYPYNKEVLATIEAVFEEDGEIRLGVSPELNRIRSEIRKTQKIQDRKFESLLRLAKQEDWLSSEEQTIRNGRRVLALLSEHKRKIKGIIHDESSTGKTTFLEPQSLVELGNDLFDLYQDEKKEVYRIFLELSNELRPFAQSIEEYQRLAGLFDFIRAKAVFAMALQADLPIVKENSQTRLVRAMHPLLFVAFKEQGRELVPLHLELSNAQRILVISGPNAGGKSICLKTVGLLQIMFQSGMLIPVDPRSEMKVYAKVFLSMGDDQSLENDLSTYSSHLKSLKHFANFSGPDTLVLLDEFGTGTDPQFGGAIAEGVLDAIVNKGAYGVATTHYSNLKLYAQGKQGVTNASMMFDQEKMLPTYQLEIGRPGSSYAFEIAQRIGINKSILEYAKDKLGDRAGSFEQLTIQLEKDKLDLTRKLQSAEKNEALYKSLLEEYKSLKEELKKNKKQLALEYKTQLQNELKNYNKRFENQLAELRKKPETEANIAKSIREKLQKDSQKVQQEVEKLKEEKRVEEQPAVELKVGDAVKLIDGSETGIIEEIKKNDALVAFNHLKTRVKLRDLTLSDEIQMAAKTKGVNVSNFIMDFAYELDVRGKRAAEAMKQVEEMLDRALILGQHSIRIIHGRGDGILKTKIWEVLRAHKGVTGMEYEHTDFGGDGVTLVHF